MADETLSRNLNFLTDAAHLLSATSPEVSAHLMTQRNLLMVENSLTQSDIQRQHVCGSCGHIMVPGQGSSLKLETSKATRARSRAGNARPIESNKQPMQGVQKVLTCGMCGRYTRINVPPAPRIARHARPPSNAGTFRRGVSSSSKAQVAEHPAKVSANASSKKRAKSRKQGLQALLQQSQSSSSKAGLGLSLTDFMKK